jgi:serralysin
MSTNLAHYCASLLPNVNTPAAGTVVSKTKAAFLDEYRWGTGATITLRFLEANEKNKDLRRRVREAASEWFKYANVILDFRENEPTNIRIAFRPGKGSWSYIGTYCKKIKEPEPTMNFGWLTPESDDTTLRSVVLHEFGHALGLIHEHQNPKGGIHWNKDAVKRDLSGPPNNWDDATIQNNMFRYYPLNQLTASAVDPLSIMMYPIPKAWTNDGFSAGFNAELSKTDKEIAKDYYPR